MHSLYTIVTGEFTGVQMDDPELRAHNTPPGCAWMAGAHDARRCVVQLLPDLAGEQIPTAVARQPARPADTEMQTWHWDETLDDWMAAPTLALRKLMAAKPLQPLFQPLDAALARPLGELMEAQALGGPPPQAAMAKLQAINASKAALRQRLADIAACSSPEALQQLLAQPLPDPLAP